MPWNEVRPMDQKVLFIGYYLRGGSSMTALCECYGISRKTGYKWIHRYQQQGAAALNEQSRTPRRHPQQTPYVIQQAILSLRRQGLDILGPKKILAHLEGQFDVADLPCPTTIYNILKRAGQIKPRRRRQRIVPGAQPFAPVRQTNDLWTVDYKGQFSLSQDQWCYPLTLMDHHSRYLLCCKGLPGTQLKPTKQAFIKAFRRYGLPRRIRSDNGTPFASRAPGGLSRLAVWWVRLGIIPERIQPGQPQQNGRHERMHRTLKGTLPVTPAHSLRAQQHHLNKFQYYYNYQRPHEALNQHPPAQHYQASTRVYPKHLPILQYPSYFQVPKVGNNGVAHWHGYQIYTSPVFSGEYIGLEQISEDVWNVYVGPVCIGWFNIRQAKGTTAPYLTLKMLPM